MNLKRYLNVCFVCLLLINISCASPPARDENEDVLAGSLNGEDTDHFEFIKSPLEEENLPVVSFNEIWAYVVSGKEQALKPGLPLSDIVYFGAEVDSYGHLENIPLRKKLPAFRGSVHISIVCNSRGLTHFVIEPESAARKILVDEILDAAKNYDGLNIDMELVPERDSGNFLSFLAELHAGIGDKKIFSVCVPARTQPGGTYDYVKIASISDKVFVMAYDEHWSTSKPGPIASMQWCKAVSDYALKTIGLKKLVMGIPFYGRSWGDSNPSRAIIHETTEKIKKEHGIEAIRRINGIPTFNYELTVKVQVYYEDEYSLATRAALYDRQGVRSIGFWRLGQESNAAWSVLQLTK
ncbi:MAG: glycoside hydrolase [Spirochaetaceae bacterium]|jgi:spore germination protein YaaH|nr:glycoside hydrolase [Spirochaetaceae bacterium]